MSATSPGMGWTPGVSPTELGWSPQHVLGRGHGPACGLALAGWCPAAACWSPALCGPSLPRYNEINAISTACSYGIVECQNLATRYFHEWEKNVSSNP